MCFVVFAFEKHSNSPIVLLVEH